ncbi:hypothetical protein LTR70_000237 [Exophiala xenobiotica]|uniref:Uncharacterized protein n=1 Tax=Lithohypha guttulata TaxID=1690604 RepID=A0ABR0K5M4_9EURO|nr:hypothetical protein LTR24_007055 [Lithohypha guttulata]KAK5330915.1 hypothetical protein LTR70_000237 [Exophiala xenobiotica]
MSLPSSPRNPDWQATRVPKLAYRKSIPQEEADQVRAHARETAIQATNVSRMDPARSSNVRPATPVEAAAPAKKKNSFLSGLFAKEPTLMALAQVEADLKSKHGAATPQAVPHVSARKLPDHVPKVNSKWDGIPEVVKQHEREEKQRKRLSGQSSLAPHQSMRSRSTESSARNSARGHKTRSRRESDARAASGTEPRRSSDRTVDRYHSPSVYTTSSEDFQEICRRPVAASVRSQSLRSPSGRSLPEIISFSTYNEQQPTSALLQPWQGVNSTTTNSAGSSDQSRYEHFQREYYGPTNDVIPEHSSSPILTPREMSPVTPGYASDPAVSLTESLSDTETSNAAPAVRPKRTVPGQIDAFLAGEARPLHINDAQRGPETDSGLPLRRYQQLRVDRVQADIAKRPDSSRARLGLSPSMVVRTEAAPWEAQEPSMAGTSSSRLAPKSRLPKALALFK